MEQTQSRPRGRPRKHSTLLEPITIRLPEPMAAEIEQIQSSRRDAPDKSQVIRELLAHALESRKQVTKAGTGGGAG